MEEEREASVDELEAAVDPEQAAELGDARYRATIDPICPP
jgi:hypothetical protein